MKIYLAISLVTSACAFSPSTFAPRRSTQLAVEVEGNQAIKDAMAASKKHGASSPEARAAWDIVEEIDAANSHHKPDDIHVKKAESKKPHEPTVYEKFCAENEGHVKDAVRRIKALEDAKKITEEKGAASPEARVAWEFVEELAATETHHKTSGTG